MNEPSGQPSREPFATYNHESCCWRTSQQSLLSENWAEPSVTWPTSGSMRNGAVYELQTPAHPTSDAGSSSLLGTPRSSDGMKHALREDVGNPRGRLEDQVALLPTAQARDGDSRTMSACTAAKRMAAGKRNLDDAVALLPTPRATDGTKGGPNQRGSSGDLMLPSAVAQLPPTPAARDWKSSASNILDRNARPLNEVVAHLLPTPQAADGERTSHAMMRGNPTLLGAVSTGPPTDPRSADGNASSDEAHPTLWLWDDEADAS